MTDAVAFGQFMFSRPIFAAPVTGLVLGDVTTGLYVGMIMELVWITVVPLGNVVPPDATVVSVSATHIASVAGGDKGYIVFLILILVPLGILFKKVDVLQREFNAYFAHKMEERLEEGDISYIDRGTYLSLGLFFLKGFLFLLILIWAGTEIFPFIYSGFGENLQEALGGTFFVLPAAGLGTAISTFMFKKSQSKDKDRR